MRAASGHVDVYLLPAVVGGGLGDIEEVLAGGRFLARSGHPVFFFRGAGRPLPRDVDGPWDWPPVVRSSRLHPRSRSAVTLTAGWGIAAAPARDEPLGRAGVWAAEARAIERRYGPHRTLHLSFEEFGRTLTTREQERERLREGGVPLRSIATRLRGWSRRTEAAELRAAFRRYRSFDRPNVVHLYPTFLRSRSFAREFPEAIQTGPFWPESERGILPGRSGRAAKQSGRSTVVWYASPSSSARIGGAVLRGLAASGRPVHLVVRSPKAFPLPPTGGVFVEWLPSVATGAWRRQFERADLRIVTGSRTLLEALVLGRPFLYFNGVLGHRRAPRRHRPEKILGLLRAWALAGSDPSWRRALAEFSRGRSVARVVPRALADAGWRMKFPSRFAPRGFVPPYDDARRVVAAVTDRLATGAASEEVARVARAAGLSPNEGILGRRDR